jgi:hypothetical protein
VVVVCPSFVVFIIPYVYTNVNTFIKDFTLILL